jgi:hypothetical protein
VRPLADSGLTCSAPQKSGADSGDIPIFGAAVILPEDGRTTPYCVVPEMTCPRGFAAFQFDNSFVDPSMSA